MKYGKSASLAGGALIGAGLMYLFDPNMGKRRFSLLRDKVVSANTRLRRAARGRSQDAKNRLHGLYCETKTFLGGKCEPTGSRSSWSRRAG